MTRVSPGGATKGGIFFNFANAERGSTGFDKKLAPSRRGGREVRWIASSPVPRSVGAQNFQATLRVSVGTAAAWSFGSVTVSTPSLISACISA